MDILVLRKWDKKAESDKPKLLTAEFRLLARLHHAEDAFFIGSGSGFVFI